MTGPDTSDRAWNERLSKYKEEVLKVVYLGVPLGILQGLTKQVSDRVLQQPREAAVFLVPIVGVTLVVAWLHTRRRSFAIDRRLLVVVGAYVLLFSTAAETRFLDWRRDPTLFGRPSERSWLTPVGWGDWRYRLVPKVSGDDLVVVLREPTAGKAREAARVELVTLMGLASSHGASGIAFDYFFDGESGVDALLCATVERLGVPAFFGYGFERFQERLNQLPVPSSLEGCIGPGNQGHLVGFLDADLQTRLTPLFFNDLPDRPALSLVIARSLAADSNLSIPDNGRLRFVEPDRPHVQVRLDTLLDDSPEHDAARNALRGRFVIVGEDSESDLFQTPFGEKSGAVVHADAAHSLLHSHYVQDAPWWAGFLLMLVSCSVLAAWCASNASAGHLVALCLTASGCFGAVAALGLVAGPYWIDVLYPSAAMWLLLPLLLGLRRQARRPGPER